MIGKEIKDFLNPSAKEAVYVIGHVKRRYNEIIPATNSSEEDSIIDQTYYGDS